MSVVGDLGFVLLQRRPEEARLIMGLARRLRPILRAGRSFVVLRDDDVREVLARRDDFEIGWANAPKMLCGDFLLGMDPSPHYDREKEILRSALPDPGGSLQALVQQVCEEVAVGLQGASPGAERRIEVVADYAERITTRISARLYGVPHDGAESRVVRGTSEDVLRLWLRKLGSVIACAWPSPFGLRRVGEACAQEFGAHLERRIAARLAEVEAGRTAGEDVLTRLLERYARGDVEDLEFVRRSVAGLMLAGSAAVAKSFVQILHQLLRRPEHFEAAVKAADSYDRAALRALANEAMRFHPTFIALPRFCPRATTLAARTPRQCEVPAGSVVYAVTLSAMFDSEAVAQPEDFCPGRDYEYLHFGMGLHWCLGEAVAVLELEEMLRTFLTLPGFASRAGRPGRIRYDGPAVDRYRMRVKLPEPAA